MRLPLSTLRRFYTQAEASEPADSLLLRRQPSTPESRVVVALARALYLCFPEADGVVAFERRTEGEVRHFLGGGWERGQAVRSASGESFSHSLAGRLACLTALLTAAQVLLESGRCSQTFDIQIQVRNRGVSLILHISTI